MKADQIEDRAGEALKFLGETDELAADLKLEAEKSLARYKAYVNAHFLTATGSIEERKRHAEKEAEPLYLDYLEAMRKFDEVSNKRKSQTLVVEWCRSLYAAYRQGR